MSEKTNTRSYEVLGGINIEEPLATAFAHICVVDATDADAAIRLAVETYGLPDKPFRSTGRCIAIPQSNWNERQVEITQQPVVSIGPVEGAQGSLEGVAEPAEGLDQTSAA